MRKNFIMMAVAVCLGFQGSRAGEEENKKGAYIEAMEIVTTIKGNSARQTVFQRTAILNPKGKDFGVLSMVESPNIPISKYEAFAYDDKGTELEKYDLSNLNKSCGFGDSFQLYSDICRYSAQPIFVQYPYFLEEKAELELKSLFFWRGYDFQSGLPVKKISYELLAPMDFQFNYKIYGRFQEPEVDTLGKQVRYFWSATDIPAEAEEDYIADCYPSAARIVFMARDLSLGKFKFSGGTWPEVGRGFSLLSKDCFLKSENKTIPGESNTAVQISAARDIYNQIISDYRYVSVSVGISGWRPNPAAMVEQRKYGDCKDLSILLVSRLRQAGLQAYPCLALTRGDGETDTTFPGYNFNHVFAAVMIDRDTVWMDPTCNKCPFGELPYSDENIAVLLMSDSGGVLVKTPVSTPELNRTLINSSITLLPGGTYRFASNIQCHGNQGNYWRSRLTGLSKDEIRECFENWPLGGSRQFNITGYNYNRDLSPDAPAVLELQGTSRKPAEHLGQVYYINPNLYGFGRYLESLELNKRTTPLDNDYPNSRIHEITFRWDSTLAVDSLAVPSDEVLEYDFARLDLTYSRNGSEAKAVLHTEMKGYYISADKMPELAEFRSRCLNLLSRPVKYFLSGR